MAVAKQYLKPRGVRLTDKTWAALKRRAAQESKKTGVTVTASDVVRHCIETAGKMQGHA